MVKSVDSFIVEVSPKPETFLAEPHQIIAPAALLQK
jgi:hypothetical protein